MSINEEVRTNTKISSDSTDFDYFYTGRTAIDHYNQHITVYDCEDFYMKITMNIYIDTVLFSKP